MRFNVAAILALLAIAWTLTACSQGSNLPMLEQTPQADESAYRLGPGDQLRVQVLGSEEISGEYNVSDAGNISLPLIGEVKAQGLTPHQLEQAVQRKLAQGYFKDPKVSVEILKYRPFYIFGEVAKPGEYPYAGGMTVRSAVALAGGYSYRANEGYVVVTRSGEDRKALPNTRILPDDIIRVPERYF